MVPGLKDTMTSLNHVSKVQQVNIMWQRPDRGKQLGALGDEETIPVPEIKEGFTDIQRKTFPHTSRGIDHQMILLLHTCLSVFLLSIPTAMPRFDLNSTDNSYIYCTTQRGQSDHIISLMKSLQGSSFPYRIKSELKNVP